MIEGVDELPGALPLQYVRELVLWLEPDVPLHLAQAEVFPLNQVKTALCCESLDAVRSLELVDEADLHVGVDELVQRVDDGLQNGNIPNLGAISVHVYLDLNLVNVAIVVGVVIQKL